MDGEFGRGEPVTAAIETGARLATLREVHALAHEKAKEYGPLAAAALTSFIRDLQDMMIRDMRGTMTKQSEQ